MTAITFSSVLWLHTEAISCCIDCLRVAAIDLTPILSGIEELDNLAE